MPETTIGFFPDVGTVSRLSRLNGKLGLYLGLTGHALKSKEVYDAGLATHFTNSKHIDELTQSFFQIKTQKDIEDIMTSLSAKTIKGKFDLDQINRTFNANSIEDIFLNLKKENTEWSKRQFKILSKMSPTSLKVTFKYITSASNYTLKEILQTDYTLSKKFIRDNDFFEGVRALLIDRGTLPMWNPPTIETAKTETIDAYFQVPNDGDPLF
jgi:3-hydroxyisobutyryl-CoA hydrolase